MAEGLKIEIVSPERLVLSETVQSVTVPGTEGYFTVMNDHAPFMTTLRPGFITVTKDSGQSDVFFVKGGFADVSPAGLTVLAEHSVPLSQFDLADIQKQIKTTEEALNRATSLDEKTQIQASLSSLLNLTVEAQQLGAAQVH